MIPHITYTIRSKNVPERPASREVTLCQNAIMPYRMHVLVKFYVYGPLSFETYGLRKTTIEI